MSTGMAPASALPPGVHPGCGRPRFIHPLAMARWVTQRRVDGGRAQRFVPLREFLADYCLCGAR